MNTGSPWRRGRAALAALVAGLVAGCGSGDDGEQPAPDAPGLATLAAEGGEVAGADQASIRVPAGALARPSTVTLARDAGEAPPLPPAVVPAGAVFAITPHGTHFAVPATVRLPFDRSRVATGERLALLKADPNGAWRLVNEVAVEGGQLVARVDSLSYFLPVSVRWPVEVVPVPPPSEARITLDLVNSSYPTLITAPGVGTRLRQQPQPGEPAVLQVTYNVPGSSSLLANPLCAARGGAVFLRLSYGTATVYRLPGETGSRVLRGSSWSTEDIGLVDPAAYGSTRSHAAQLDPLAYRHRLDDRPAAPPGSTDDGGALTVDLELSCSGVLLPPPSTTIAITAGYPEVDTYLLAQPQPVAVREGDDIGVPDVPVYSRLPEWERYWEVSDPSGANFTRSAGGSALDELGRLAPGAYGFAYDGLRQRLVGRARAADNGRLLRTVVCTTSPFLPGSNIECLTSEPARLTVTAVPPTPPRFNLQPASATHEAGQWLQISAGWEAAPAPVAVTWQWRADAGAAWQAVDPALYEVRTAPGSASAWRGTTSVALTARALALGDNGLQFRASFSTSAGSATSDVATIGVVAAVQAPVFTVQPADAALASGAPLQLYTVAAGGSPLSYQWFKDGAPVAGANAAALVIDPANTTNAGSYVLQVSNRVGTLRSREARVTVTATGSPDIAPLAVTRQPQATRVAAGGTAAFVASFSGSPATLQWLRNGVALPGETGPALVIADVGPADEADYALLAANVLGSVRTTPARLSVLTDGAPNTAPAIATQPVGLALVAGQTATLAVAASGSGPLAYQWRRDGTPLPGATGPVLTLADLQPGNAGSYTVVVSNAAGSVTSDAAGLAVTPVPGAPTITTQPLARSVASGAAVEFTLAVTGNPAPRCLWMRNGIAIAGATSCSGLRLPAAALADNGAVISVIVYNSGGFVLSGPAVLTVYSGEPPAITTQPASPVWSSGAVVFTVGASGVPAPAIDWTADNERLGAGGRYVLGGCSFDFVASGATLTLTNVAEACIGTPFFAIASNDAGRVTSDTVVLLAPSVSASLVAGLPGTPGSADGAGGAARFDTPNYVTAAADGRIAVGDFANSTIRLVTPPDAVSTLAGSAGAVGFADGSGSSARFARNGGLAYDAAGNLFVCDWDNHVVRRITPEGVVSTVAGSPGVAGSADGSGTAARLRNPNGLAIDAAGNLYVADWGNHTLRRITPAGVVSTIAGSAGVPGAADGSGPAARFSLPGGLALDAAGNLYVADIGNHTVRKITPAGVVSTLAGQPGVADTVDGSGSDARFDTPAWLAATADGTLFVVSGAGDTVRRVSPAGVVETVVGVAGDNSALRLGSNPRLRGARGVWALGAKDLLLNADQALIRVRLP